MIYPKYLRGFTKITLILSFIVAIVLSTSTGMSRGPIYIEDVLKSFAIGFVSVPLCAISLWFLITMLYELYKNIAMDFRNEQ